MDPVSAIVKPVAQAYWSPAGSNWGHFGTPESESLVGQIIEEFDAAKRLVPLTKLHEYESEQELGMGTIFATHDLGVAEIADRMAVMYSRLVIEEGPVNEVLRHPAHPYTAGLLASTVHDQAPEQDIAAIPGSPPDMRRLPPKPVYPAVNRMARSLRMGNMLQRQEGAFR